MDSDYLKVILTANIGWVMAIIGWVTAHYFSNKRAIESKRREIVSEHLIKAYKILTHEITNRKQIEIRRTYLENIISDIQLFGSLKQVDLAKKLADGVAEKKYYKLDPLINCLRESLREELNLSPVTGNVKCLRFDETP